MLVHLEKENFNELISTGIVLVDFYAEWCGPCKMLGPILEDISKEVKVVKVDVDMHQDLSRNFKIMSVPTVIIYKDGKVVSSFMGFRDKEFIINEIKKVG